MSKTYGKKYVTTVLLCVLSLLSETVYSEFGDFVDPTFNCPAITTCPVMCVWDEWYCPPTMRCPSGTDLCLDGTCVNSTIGCDPTIESPCWENLCGNEVQCAKIVDYYDKCVYDHDFMYTNATECVDEWRMPVVPWNAPGFVASYAWIGGITFFIIAWCACNQRFFPVGEAEPLLDASKMLVTVERLKRDMARKKEEFVDDDDDMEASEKVDIDWTQTAYKNTFIGNLLYWCTVLTMWAFQVLMLLLTLGFYATETEFYHLTPIKDTKQILFCFQLVWMIGFVWCLSLKWPSSLRSLFLRRTHFNTATHISVFSPETGNLNVSKDERINLMAKFVNILGGCINGFFMVLFSDINRTKHGTTTYCNVETDAFGERFFTYRLSRYTYDEEEGCFKPGVIVVGSTIGEIIDSNVGLTSEEVKYRHSVVGPNSLPIRAPSFISTVIEEFNQAFYLYQNYMVWTWLNYWYYHMGIVETIVRLIAGIAVAVVNYKMAKNTCRLSNVTGEVEVLRDGKFVTISQQDIAPGEVVSVTPGIVYCDMVLVKGCHVLVDESALTGEANPIYKTKVDLAASKEAYDPKTHKVHTISAGTLVIESDTKERDLAVVIKTGSFTTKGELLREMLYNTPHRFKFDTEVMIVLCILFIEAVILFGVVFHFLQEEPVYAWFFGMFVVATCVPPLLPTVFVVSVGISAERLLSKRIAVTDNDRILVAGKVQIAFFDKTGTLTKQGLEFQVARSYKDGSFDDLSTPSGNLGMGMTACHTLAESSDHKIVGHLLERIMFEETGASFIPHSNDTKVQIKSKDGSILNVLKRFEFDYTTQTQSVLVEDGNNGKYYVFAKGSVEAIKKICHESTMPHDINEVSAASSREGIYQIAFAMSEVSKDISKNISSHRVSEDDGEIIMQDDARDDFLARLPREKIEQNLTFIGFIDFINTMKEETPGVMKTLEEGNIRTIMLTGDSVLTGIHIAKKGGMIEPDALVIFGKDIDEEGNVQWVDSIASKPIKLPSLAELRSQKSSIALAVTGKVWSTMLETNKDLADYLAYYIRVHGRCTPHDKVSVCSYFVKKGYMTLMCGDGGNDCGALKTAHVGIALSDAEASVVSPFTSMDKSIESVVDVLKEGRCALCSAIASYKYMIMYGQVETINQVVCAYFKTTPGDWNWIFMDGIWVIIMAFTLPLSKAAKKLAPSRPTSSLLGPHTMTSAIGILAINFFFVAISLWILHQQDWYKCRKWEGGNLSNLSYICDNYETSVIFLISGYQYTSSAVPYNFGFAYRADWIKNHIFVFFVVAFTALHFYVTLVPGSVSCLFRVNCVNENVVPDPFGDIIAIQNSFNTTVMPMDFRVILISIMIMNLAANIVWEYFIVNGDYSWWKNYKNKHE